MGRMVAGGEGDWEGGRKGCKWVGGDSVGTKGLEERGQGLGMAGSKTLGNPGRAASASDDAEGRPEDTQRARLEGGRRNERAG